MDAILQSIPDGNLQLISEANSSWRKVFPFAEMMKPMVARGTGLPSTPSGLKWVLNYTVVDKTSDFIVNLFRLNCRTLGCKS
jgi:hypothetical protein